MDNTQDNAASTTTGRRRKAWFWPLTGLILATGVGAVAMTNAFQPAPLAAVVEAPAVERVVQLHPVEVAVIQPRDLVETIKVSGNVYPAQEAAIAAQVSGLAEKVTVRPGDAVAQGDLLVEVGTTDLQLQLEQQRATVISTEVQLQAAQALLERTRILVGKQVAAQSTLDTASADVDKLEATIVTQQTQVALAEANLARAKVTAPFSGTVWERSIEPGQVVSPGTTMLSIVDLSSVRAEVVVGMRDLAHIAPGQQVTLSMPGSDDTFRGTVDRVSPVAEAGTRSIKVYLTLDNAEGKLRGGMFVTGEIIVQETEDVLAVPATAVHTRDGQSYVMAVADGVLEERPVEIATLWKGSKFVEARAGLAAGDTILSSQLSGATAGLPVVIGAN
jgi:membrane fusion protein (multidrug efflux system)